MVLKTKKISTLTKQLINPDSSKRRSAADALADGDERAVYPLINALRDSNPGVQDAAMRSLISIGGEVTAYMVIPLLREDPCLRNTALIILKDLGKTSIPFLYPLLKDKDDDVRKFSLDLLGEIKDEVSPEKIVPLFHDPNANVRAAAVKTVAELMYEEAVPDLIGVLKDEEWVCFSVLEALAKLKDERSVDPIVELLSSESDTLRYAAIETLGEIGSSLSSSALLSHLSNTDGFEKTATIKSLIQIGITPVMSGVSDVLIDMFINADWDEKLIALKGLVDLKEEKAVYTIVDVAGSLDPSDPESDERLLRIKDALKSYGCTDVLLDVLNSSSLRYRGRAIAIEVLGDLGCEKAVPHLMRFSVEDFTDVRRASVKALGEINDEEATQTLIDAIDDQDGHVRATAVTALGKIGDKTAFDPILSLLFKERYKNVIEDAVKTLLSIDSPALFLHLDEFDVTVKELIAKHTADVGILISLSRDKDLNVKVSALSGLGRMRDEEAYTRLNEAIHDNEPEVRRAAVIAMGELNCCHDEIKSALNDEDMWVRHYAVKALGNSFRQDMMNTLIPMLEDKNIPVVLSTVDAIAQLGGREAFSILNPLRDHDDSAIREKASEVLEGLLRE